MRPSMPPTRRFRMLSMLCVRCREPLDSVGPIGGLSETLAPAVDAVAIEEEAVDGDGEVLGVQASAMMVLVGDSGGLLAERGNVRLAMEVGVGSGLFNGMLGVFRTFEVVEVEEDVVVVVVEVVVEEVGSIENKSASEYRLIRLVRSSNKRMNDLLASIMCHVCGSSNTIGSVLLTCCPSCSCDCFSNSIVSNC
jgi:hypothetical protein